MKLSETMQSAVDCANCLDPGGQIVLIVPAWIKQLKGLEAEVDRLRPLVISEVLLEKLADLEHQRWSRWMCWMFDNWCQENVARWKQQMQTSYANLPEHSKELDRKEARRMLAVLREAAEVEGSEQRGLGPAT